MFGNRPFGVFLIILLVLSFVMPIYSDVFASSEQDSKLERKALVQSNDLSVVEIEKNRNNSESFLDKVKRIWNWNLFDWVFYLISIT